MLVVSGLFVLLALGLLVAGLATGAVGQVYLSIGASLVAAALLALGVYQRRPPSAGQPPT
ncbi:MAG: hypothetical protein ACR2JO_09405 [Mycobacteriales bacterium]